MFFFGILLEKFQQFKKKAKILGSLFERFAFFLLEFFDFFFPSKLQYRWSFACVKAKYLQVIIGWN